MHVRRVLVAVSTAVLLVGGSIALPAMAGVAAPADIIVSPNTGPVGTHVTIANAENSPCGADQGDPEAAVDVLVTQPNGDDSLAHANLDVNGDWTLVYLDTTQVGVYQVDAQCFDVPSGATPRATDFDYTTATFVITADEPTTTAAPTTTSTAPAAAAVDATAAFTG